MKPSTYVSLHGGLVQLQVLLGGPLLQQLRAQRVDLVPAAVDPVHQHLGVALLLLQLHLQPLHLVLQNQTSNDQVWDILEEYSSN